MGDPAADASLSGGGRSEPRLLDLMVVAAAASATVLLFSPANVYYRNALEFPLRFRDALPYLLLLTVAATLLTTGLVSVLKSAWRAPAVSLLLGIAVSAWIQGNLLTWNYGSLDGREIDWSASPWRGVVDGAVWLAVLIGAALGWRVVSRHARDGALGLLAVQLVGAMVTAKTNDTPSYVLHDFDFDVECRLSSKRNAVVLVLDGLQGTEFATVIAEHPTLVSTFQGFTYFRDALADFSITHSSIPAILTARRYDNSQSYVSFVEEAYNSSSSLPKRLRQNGFIVDIYALSKALWSDPAVLSNLPAESRGLRAIGGNLAFLVDLGVFRCAPHPLKRVVYAKQSWLLPRLAVHLGFGSRTPMATTGILSNAMFIADLTGKAAADGRLEDAPVFKFFHVQGPHPPLSVDDTGRPAELVFSAENYRKAVIGSIRIAGLLLEFMRRKGLYDESLILIVSDHGGGVPVVLPPALAAGAGPQGPTIRSRALPLVLVKPIGAHGSLRVSDAPVQLSDIPKTVLSQLGLPSLGVPGADMFALTSGEERARVHYAMPDTNWAVSRHLSAMTEYAVHGFGWYASSWRATGRVLGSQREALELYKRLAGVPQLGELSLTSSAGDEPTVFVNNEGELIGAFPPLLQNPKRGDFSTITLPLRGLKPGTDYRLGFDLVDNYGEDHPGRLMQMAWFDDRLICANDIGAGRFSGAREIEWRFRASSSSAVLRVEVRAVGDPEEGWQWGEVWSMALGRLRLESIEPSMRPE